MAKNPSNHRKKCLHARSPQTFVLDPNGQAALITDDQPPAQPGIIQQPQEQQIPQQFSSTTTPTLLRQTSPLSAVVASPSIVSSADSSVSSSVFVPSSSIYPASSTSLLDLTSSSFSSTAFSTSSSVNSVPSSFTSPTSTISSALAGSSIAISSAANIAAVASPSQTSAAAAETLSSHPPLYIAIILGTIAVISCIAALIAWFFRLRSHRKRCDDSPIVPWAKSDPCSEEKLEEGKFVGSGQPGISEADMAFHSWEPRGDRDVGEPKRSASYFIKSPVKASPFVDPFGDGHQVAPLSESVAYPFPPQYPVPAQLSNNDTGDSIPIHSANSLGTLQVANMVPGDQSAFSSRAPTALGLRMDEFGTPREMTRPRFLGLNGEGLDVPWKLPSPLLTDPETTRTNWDHLPPLPMPGEAGHYHREPEGPEDAGWTSSIKYNLVQAFNAVAASFPSASGHITLSDDDALTPVPQRRIARPRSVFYSQASLSRQSTAHSSVWSLEETAQGMGRVHFRGLESYGGGDDAFSLGPPSTISSSTVFCRIPRFCMDSGIPDTSDYHQETISTRFQDPETGLAIQSWTKRDNFSSQQRSFDRLFYR
ncbi:hypothetical protein C8J56DRAFT_1171286 [Mycena floridula]|nr:hypothetical protein C8J56DRAFT_1171286 [Mycena floridula]